MAWPNFEVEVLKQGKLFSTCKQIKTGKIFKIKNEFLYLNNQKYYCLDDYVDYLIPLEKGEVIKLVGIYGPYAYVIKDNEIGSVSYTHLDVYKRQEYVLESIKTIYGIKHINGAIRRVNVNIAATTVENYKKLKEAGIGTYILFQETYNKKNYEALHPTGPKHDYAYHTEAMDRAMDGGIDDVGIGVLFGLEMYRYDFVGLLMHAEHLEAAKGVGPHTISVPRICPADDIDKSDFSNAISDKIFEKIVMIIRICLLYTSRCV